MRPDDTERKVGEKAKVHRGKAYGKSDGVEEYGVHSDDSNKSDLL